MKGEGPNIGDISRSSLNSSVVVLYLHWLYYNSDSRAGLLRLVAGGQPGLSHYEYLNKFVIKQH